MTREDFIELVREAGVTVVHGDDNVYQKRNGRPYVFGMYSFKSVASLYLEVDMDDFTSVLWQVDGGHNDARRLVGFQGISPIRFLVSLDGYALECLRGKLAEAQFASTMTRENLDGFKKVQEYLKQLS